MAPTPSSSSRHPKEQKHHTHLTIRSTPSKTPQSRHRLHFPSMRTPNPASAVPTEHPVEVISRIRDYPDRKEKPETLLEVAEDGRSVRVRTDIGYRDFSLDGLSASEDENLGVFYSRFVESRIRGVRLGAKCTIMMYGPTGSGKSHTMFGCARQPGIVYMALRDILGEVGEEEKENSGAGVDDGGFGIGLFVQVAVLEIYNEEIYDLLSGSSGSGAGVGLPKGNTPRTKLEVMGKKARNATYITGNEAGKISREVAKIEKRRIVKSTLCNERSSRSHCLIILDVPSVGGRLMLVDMAGSENIEQAGQTGFEAKMQTARINQGNTTLKRVVESIANGDSHIPFRDSKLTMLLQDSFEDDKSKILMILCASPDPKEMHKTISTLEYGAKAKCIVRVTHMPNPKDKITSDESSAVMLGSRIAAMNEFIHKLQMENKVKEKEHDDAQKELQRKDEQVAELRARIKLLEGRGTAAKEHEINSKVGEKTMIFKLQLEKMEQKMAEQEKEIEMLRQQVMEVESRRGQSDDDTLLDFAGSRFMKRLSEIYAEGDQGMEKSMELDMGDQQHDVKEVVVARQKMPHVLPPADEDASCNSTMKLPQKFSLSTVFEGNEEEQEEMEGVEEEAVEKEVIEEKKVNTYPLNLDAEKEEGHIPFHGPHEYEKDTTASRSTRIQNIFRLCGSYRELSSSMVDAEELALTPLSKEAQKVQRIQPDLKQQDCFQPGPDMTVAESPASALLRAFSALDLSYDQKSEKENCRPGDAVADGLVDIYVKWETSKEVSGSLIKKLKVMKNATLVDLRKLIETHLSEENNLQPFSFLLLGDPTGAPVNKDKEMSTEVSKLPICNNQLRGHLACLRPTKKNTQNSNHIPLTSLDNKFPALNTSLDVLHHPEGFSPKLGHNISYLTGLRA